MVLLMITTAEGQTIGVTRAEKPGGLRGVEITSVELGLPDRDALVLSVRDAITLGHALLMAAGAK